MADQAFTGSTTLTANTFTKAGYAFNGWNTASDGSGTSYGDKASYSGAGITLYAVWSATVTYTITSNAVSVTGLADSSTTDLIIPSYIEGYPVTSIADSAFEGTSSDERGSLTSVVIPDTITSIGNYAFRYNNLTSVDIPDSVTSIGWSAFAYNSLESVDISDSVTSIKEGTFRNNSLTSVVIPDSVTSIGNSAFRYNNLTSVVIPDSVTEIKGYAFIINPLESVYIPSGVTSIAQYAFNPNDDDVECIIYMEGWSASWTAPTDWSTLWDYGTYEVKAWVR